LQSFGEAHEENGARVGVCCEDEDVVPAFSATSTSTLLCYICSWEVNEASCNRVPAYLSIVDAPIIGTRSKELS